MLTIAMTISSPVVRKPEPRRFHDHRVELKYVYLYRTAVLRPV
jgi:hypothetical protein